MIHYDPDEDGSAYESPDDERMLVKPRPKKRDRVRAKWRPLRHQRPVVVRGFGR